MDYKFITCKDFDNLNKDNGTVSFYYNPTEKINFFESSLVLDITLKIASDGLDNTQLATIVKEKKGIIKFNKFFIYKYFKTIKIEDDNEKFSETQYVYDYVRLKNITKNNMNSIMGFDYLPISDTIVGEYKMHFLIPLKCLFPEFEDLFYYSDTRKALTIINKNLLGEKDIFEKTDYKFKISEFVVNDLKLKIPVRYDIIDNISTKMTCYRKVNQHEYNVLQETVENDIYIKNTKNKPLYVNFMLKDSRDRIISPGDELDSIQLQINDVYYPNYEMKLTTSNDISYLYEMYIRYLDFYYGKDRFYYKNGNSYYTFEEYKEHPIICFILPQLPEDSSYEIFFKIKFKNASKKTKKISYMLTYLS